MSAPVIGNIADRQQEDRLAAHTEIMAVKTRDLASLSDLEFEKGLERVKTIQVRMQRILKETLTVDVHFGREKDSGGRPVFKKDRLKKAGAEEIRRIIKLTCKDVADPVIVADADACYVVVNRGIFDAYGNCLATARGACHTKEKRFKSRSGGWTYTDPREELHNCVAMANKRTDSLLTAEASGATAFFSDGDDMVDALEDEKQIKPWTDSEKTIVGEAAATKGMGRNTFAKVVRDTLGRSEVGTGDDVKKLLNAIAVWVKPPKVDAPETKAEPKPEPSDADDRSPEEIAEENRMASE